MNTRTTTFLLVLLGTLSLGACNSTTNLADGGIGGTGISAGTVTGFGSIYVNGVKYETTPDTLYQRNDAAALEDEFNVGEVVVVDWEEQDEGTRVATQVSFAALLKGPVTTAPGPGANTVEVLGQTVVTDETTVFQGFVLLEDLSVLDTLEVSGFFDADGAIHATLIKQPDTRSTTVELKGNIDEIISDQELRIGNQTVNLSNVITISGGALEENQFAEIKGTYASGIVYAETVEVGAVELEAESGEEIELEGFVTRFVSETDFDVDGQAVTTTAATTFEDGTSSNLGLNAKVEVEGVLDPLGVLVAEKVKFRVVSNLKIEADVQAVDVAAGTVTILGMTVLTDELTQFEDDSDQKVKKFSLADVDPDVDQLEIRAYLSGTQLIASRLERVDPDDKVRLKGPVTELNNPVITILDVDVDTTTVTDYEGVADQTEFFGTVQVNDIVQAKGRETGSGIVWEAIELDD